MYIIHAKPCMWRSAHFGKIQLLVDFTPLALFKTISVNFFHRVILEKWSTCTITWLRILIQTVVYIIHAKPCMWRSAHFGKIQLLVDFTPLALYKTISNHILHKVILGYLSVGTITWLRMLIQTVVYIIHAKPYICRSVHFGKKWKSYYELILYLWLYI